jgi:ectoine hydroxylase-related dioxygenase (phytanoyl-CoA dioxygenase family)
MVHAIEEDGFLYLPNVLNREEVNLLRSRIDSVSANPEAHDVDLGGTTIGGLSAEVNKHIKAIFNRDAHFLQYLDKEPVIDVEEALLGKDCHAIGMTAWITGPGRTAQPLHADYQPLEVAEELLASKQVTVPVFISTAHYYLDDTTEELGPTKFIPGSHLAGRAPVNGVDTNWRGKEPQSALVKAGDVMVFRSDVWHRGSANTTDRGRYLLQVHYGRKFVHKFYTPYMNFRFDPDILAQATPRQRRLMGDHPPGAYA